VRSSTQHTSHSPVPPIIVSFNIPIIPNESIRREMSDLSGFELLGTAIKKYRLFNGIFTTRVFIIYNVIYIIIIITTRLH
jgi:hypothetical protein